VAELPEGIEWKIIKTGYFSHISLLDDNIYKIVVEKGIVEC
jgi:hypothetical protein